MKIAFSSKDWSDSKSWISTSSSVESTNQAFETGTDDSHDTHGNRWKTTVIRLGPLAGICSLLIHVLSILISLAVLLGSRGAPVGSWHVPPSSWLAACTAVGNQAIRFAAFHGVAIAWWVNAYRGSTLGRLHSDWQAGTHFLGALASGRRMGWLGLACLSSTLVAIDGPFMQRATTIQPGVYSAMSVPLTVNISHEIPWPTGAYLIKNQTSNQKADLFNATVPSGNISLEGNVETLTGPFLDAYIGVPWSRHSHLARVGVVSGCQGICHARVRAPALAPISCSSHAMPIDFRKPPKLNYGLLRGGVPTPNVRDVSFIIAPSLDVQGGRERINLVTAYSQLENCVGTLHITACTLASATGEYDITVDGVKDMLTLDTPLKPHIVGLARNEATALLGAPEQGSHLYESTLAGIVELSKEAWSASTMYFDDNGGTGILPVNPQASDPFLALAHEGEHRCPSYSDPTETILESMNELMFYVGALATKLEYTTTPLFETNVTGQVEQKGEVFHTDLPWFVAALVVEVMCIAIILPTYRGYWKLGRHVSLSPLELIKAFDAQILASHNSNSSARKMAEAKQSTSVKYGLIRGQRPGSASRLGFASPSVVEFPEQDGRFDV